jgi:hypothetical protein
MLSSIGKMMTLRPQMYQQVFIQQASLVQTQSRYIGKTESPHKYKTPKMRMRKLDMVYPAPGNDIINLIPGKKSVNFPFRVLGC